MSNYVKATNFYAKDALSTGNPDKVIKGSEIDTEFNAISTAIATKADTNNPTYTGVVTAPSFVGDLTGDVTGDVTGNVSGSAGTASTAGAIANTGGWAITPNGTLLDFKYNGTKVGTLSSTGDLTVIGNVTAYGTV